MGLSTSFMEIAMTAMRRLPHGVLTTLMMMALLCVPAQGFELQAGVHGMAWGSSPADHDHLVRIREDGPVSYHVHRNMRYRAANQPVPGVIYGFFQDRLFAVYIKLRSPDQAYHMEERFRAEYGPAKVTTSSAGGQTVYRWQDQAIKIKLKIIESTDEIKLGIYYRPLVTQRNQVQIEAVPPATFHHAPVKDQPTESAPLL